MNNKFIEDLVLSYYNWYKSKVDLIADFPIKILVIDNNTQYSSCKFSNETFIIRINTKQAALPFTEYSHYKNDIEIGDFEGNEIQKLKAIVAHEVAHIFEFLDRAIYSDIRKERSHGATFQNHYRVLRNNFVNTAAV